MKLKDGDVRRFMAKYLTEQGIPGSILEAHTQSNKVTLRITATKRSVHPSAEFNDDSVIQFRQFPPTTPLRNPAAHSACQLNGAANSCHGSSPSDSKSHGILSAAESPICETVSAIILPQSTTERVDEWVTNSGQSREAPLRQLPIER